MFEFIVAKSAAKFETASKIAVAATELSFVNPFVCVLYSCLCADFKFCVFLVIYP